MSAQDAARSRPRLELPDNVSVAIAGVREEGQTLTQRFEPSFYVSPPDFELVVQWYRCSSLLICDWRADSRSHRDKLCPHGRRCRGDHRGQRAAEVVFDPQPGSTPAPQPVGSPPPTDQPPEVSITPAATDAVASTGWYNRETSGSDGVEIDVVAADASGVSKLVCHDGNDEVLDVEDTHGAIVLGDGQPCDRVCRDR